MCTRYSDLLTDLKANPTIVRAHQTLATLVYFARQRRVPVEYGEVLDAMGLDLRFDPACMLQLSRGKDNWLNIIAEYCHQNGLPRIAAMVVNRETGLPGPGYYSSWHLGIEGQAQLAEALPQDQRNIANFRWEDFVMPTLDELARSWRTRSKPELLAVATRAEC